MLSLAQQLELYTSLDIPDWLRADSAYRADPVRFLNEYRGAWAFTEGDVRNYLERNPTLIDEYLRHCATLDGTHDKALLRERGREFVVYWVDHGVARDQHHFRDRLDAAVKWLEWRYMN